MTTFTSIRPHHSMTVMVIQHHSLAFTYLISCVTTVLPQSSLTSYVTSTARRVLDIAKLTSKAQ